MLMTEGFTLFIIRLTSSFDTFLTYSVRNLLKVPGEKVNSKVTANYYTGTLNFPQKLDKNLLFDPRFRNFLQVPSS